MLPNGVGAPLTSALTIIGFHGIVLNSFLTRYRIGGVVIFRR